VIEYPMRLELWVIQILIGVSSPHCCSQSTLTPRGGWWRFPPKCLTGLCLQTIENTGDLGIEGLRFGHLVREVVQTLSAQGRQSMISTQSCLISPSS
jgi:hypothetical protein